MTIQPVQTTVGHPPWCAEHIPSCISVDQVVEATAGPEYHRVCVALEQAPGEPVAVRLMGAGDAPMQLDQALQLGLTLISLAFAGAAGQAVTR